LFVRIAGKAGGDCFEVWAAENNAQRMRRKREKEEIKKGSATPRITTIWKKSAVLYQQHPGKLQRAAFKRVSLRRGPEALRKRRDGECTRKK